MAVFKSQTYPPSLHFSLYLGAECSKNIRGSLRGEVYTAGGLVPSICHAIFVHRKTLLFKRMTWPCDRHCTRFALPNVCPFRAKAKGPSQRRSTGNLRSACNAFAPLLSTKEEGREPPWLSFSETKAGRRPLPGRKTKQGREPPRSKPAPLRA